MQADQFLTNVDNRPGEPCDMKVSSTVRRGGVEKVPVRGNSSARLPYMYMGSSFPIIGQWKQDNPRAANQVVMGLLFVIAASTVASLISF